MLVLLTTTTAPTPLLRVGLPVLDAEWSDFQEIQVAGDRTPVWSDVGDPGIVGDEVARLESQVLQVECMARGDLGERLGGVERDDLLFLAVDAVHEFEVTNTEVVGRLGFDPGFIDERDPDVASWRGKPHGGFGVLHDLDEVLGRRRPSRRAGRFEFDVIEPPGGHLKLRGERPLRVEGERNRDSVVERDGARRDRDGRGGLESNGGTGRRVDVAAILEDLWIEAGVSREHELHLEPVDVGEIQDRDRIDG